LINLFIFVRRIYIIIAKWTIKRKGSVSEALIFRRRLNLLSLLLGGVN